MKEEQEFLTIVERTAHLARLGPYNETAGLKLAQEFKRILELFTVLGELKEAPADSPEMMNLLRADAVLAFAQQEKIIENFPAKQGRLLKVPKVLE